MINSVDGSAANPWRLCSIQQVEEVKCLLRVIPIWIAGTIYYVSVVQSQNYVIFQAIQTDSKLGHINFHIPPASFIVISMLSITIWLPIYDRLLLPWLQKFTGIDGQWDDYSLNLPCPILPCFEFFHFQPAPLFFFIIYLFYRERRWNYPSSENGNWNISFYHHNDRIRRC